MKNKKNILILVTIAAIFVAVYLYIENHQNKHKIKELEEDKLKLILDSLTRHPEISKEIKTQIEKLIVKFKNIDIKVANELAQALQLLSIGQHEKAIEDLVKIIEHLLTVHYQNDSEYKSWLKQEKKKNDLNNMLIYCKQQKKITEIEFNFFVAIKTIRNKEAHTVDLRLDEHLTAAGLIAGIRGILTIATFAYPSHNMDQIEQSILA